MKDEDVWGEVAPTTSEGGWGEVAPTTSGDGAWGEVEALEGTQGADGFKPSAPAGAFSASVDRTRSAFNEVIGDEKAAEEFMTRAQLYQPGITFDDIKDNPTLFGKVADAIEWFGTEALPGIATSLGVLGAGVVAAPFTGGASVPASFAIAGGLTFGETYGNLSTEQRMAGLEESTGRNLVAATAVTAIDLLSAKNPVAKQMLLNSPLLKNIVAKTITRGALEATEEVVTTTGALVAENMVGRGQTFSESMENFDEALLTSVAMRSTLSAPRLAIDVKDKVIGRDKYDNPLRPDNQATLDADQADLNEVLRDNTKSTKEKTNKARELWASRDLENSAEAARELNRQGGVVTPSALDVDVSFKQPKLDEFGNVKKKSNGAIDYEDGLKSRNLSEELGINTVPDKVARTISEKFKIPLVGKMFDPSKDFAKTEKAFGKMTENFQVEMNSVADKLNLNAKDRKVFIDDVNNYTNGFSKDISEKSKNFLTWTGDLGAFDKVTVQKRARQFTEKMRPATKQPGGLNAAIAAGVEAVSFGGVPLITPIAGTIPAAIAQGLSAQQRAKMEHMLKTDSKAYADYVRALETLEALAVRSEGERLEEEVKEKVKPDMGTLELVK